MGELSSRVNSVVRSTRGSKFRQCASVEAVQAAQDDAFMAMRSLEHYIRWLNEVHVERAEHFARQATEGKAGEDR